MNTEDLKNIVKDIVAQAEKLKQELIADPAPVNYACIFCQSDEEFETHLDLAGQLGKVVQKTKTGTVFQIEPLSTIAGDLKLLKIRKPGPSRPEQGDADFSLPNYDAFKSKHINQKGFKLIDKGDFEMIEYKALNANVLLYFSNPTLGETLGIA